MYYQRSLGEGDSSSPVGGGRLASLQACVEQHGAHDKEHSDGAWDRYSQH